MCSGSISDLIRQFLGKMSGILGKKSYDVKLTAVALPICPAPSPTL